MRQGTGKAGKTMAKENKTMANETKESAKPIETKESAPPIEAPKEAIQLKVTKIPQKLKVTDLDTGSDDAEITNNYQKYTAPEYDAKKHGDRAAFYKTLFDLASALVQPIENQIDALLYRATQDSYQQGKVAAYAGGNYLSPELKSTITMVVKQSSPKYADSSNSDAFASWKAAFTSASSFNGTTFTPEQIAKRKAGADKVLATAQALGDSGADLF